MTDKPSNPPAPRDRTLLPSLLNLRVRLGRENARRSSRPLRPTLGAQCGCATLCYMATVGVRELRQNLSVYLERVKKGEAMTVTERGQVVAMLRPPDATGSVTERLVAEGRARRATRAVTTLSKPLRLSLARPLSATISDDRDDRL